VVMKTGVCGKSTINYDELCNWTCMCSKELGCSWSVECPDGHGGYTQTSGTGQVQTNPGHPDHFSYDGVTEVIARQLSRITGKRVIVPEPELHTRISGEIVGDLIAGARKLGWTVAEGLMSAD
jgi:hypothetical protein